jgi:hypothetical protein
MGRERTSLVSAPAPGVLRPAAEVACAATKSSDLSESALKKLVLPLFCLLFALAFSACGGDSEESRVEATLREALLGDDPAKCTELLTADYRDQVASEEGKAALRECEEEVEETSVEDPKAITVGNIEIGGSTATGQAAIKGGNFDGQSVEIALVRDGDGWQLDEIVRFTKLDRALLVPALRKDLENVEESEEAEEAPQHQQRCFLDRLGVASRQRLEGLLFGQSDADLVWLAQECPERIFPGPDENRVTRTIGKLLSSKDPTLCLEVATQRFLERNTRRDGIAAIEACNAVVHARRNLTNVVRVTDVVVEGSRATGNAEVLTKGLGLEGQVLTFELVEERGYWRVDRSLGFAKLDRFALTKGVLEGVSAVGGDVTRSMTECVSVVLDRLPRTEVESLLLYPSVARARELFGPCFAAAQEQPRSL